MTNELTVQTEYTSAELATAVGVSQRTICDWVKELNPPSRRITSNHGYRILYTITPEQLLSWKQQQQQQLLLKQRVNSQLDKLDKVDTALQDLTGETVEQLKLHEYVQNLRDDHSIEAMQEVFNNAAGFFAMFGEKIAQVNEALSAKDKQINAWKQVTREYIGRVAMISPTSYREEVREEEAYAESKVQDILNDR